MVEKVKVMSYNAWKQTKKNDLPQMERIEKINLAGQSLVVSLAIEQVKQEKLKLKRLQEKIKTRLADYKDTTLENYNSFLKYQKEYALSQGWEVVITEEVQDF